MFKCFMNKKSLIDNDIDIDEIYKKRIAQGFPIPEKREVPSTILLPQRNLSGIFMKTPGYVGQITFYCGGAGVVLYDSGINYCPKNLLEVLNNQLLIGLVKYSEAHLDTLDRILYLSDFEFEYMDPSVELKLEQKYTNIYGKETFIKYQGGLCGQPLCDINNFNRDIKIETETHIKNNKLEMIKLIVKRELIKEDTIYQQHRSPGYKDYILVPKNYCKIISHDGCNFYNKYKYMDTYNWDITSMGCNICYSLSKYIKKYCKMELIDGVDIPIYQGPKEYLPGYIDPKIERKNIVKQRLTNGEISKEEARKLIIEIIDSSNHSPYVSEDENDDIELKIPKNRKYFDEK
jgi:hypothetical protein